MNSFSRDIKEINMFINASNISNSMNDFSCCLDLLTEFTEDEYNNVKANYYRNTIEIDEDFKCSIKKLAFICNKSNCCKCPINKYCNHYINSLRKNNKNKFKIIDLFCGAGGLSLGFTQEDFAIVLANDIQECCIDTYSHNHPEVSRKNIVLGDIKEITNNINKYITTKIDVVVGGPPCQGFSMANRQRIIDDPRNSLYKSFVEIVNITKPTYFVMENVKGMMSVAEQVVEDFSKIGYQVQYKVLNAKDFGVPQNRERLIYIGSNVDDDISKIFNEIELEKSKTKKHVLKDAIYGLRPLKASTIKNSTEDGSCGSGFVIEKNKQQKTNEYISLINQNKNYEYVLNHQARYNNDRDIEIYGRLNQGDKSNDPKIADIMPYKNREDIFTDKYFKLENNKICKTITAHMKFDCNMYIHPTQARGLTPREAARVQSYPDNYFFRGAYTKTYMQIGNSVPPLLGRAIATVIKKHIKPLGNMSSD